MHYIILGAKNTWTLEELVNAEMEKGYRPVGGVMFHFGCFYQAMEKYK